LRCADYIRDVYLMRILHYMVLAGTLGNSEQWSLSIWFEVFEHLCVKLNVVLLV